ncbi:phosphonate ABC transporter, permease protein PhnE [bacterium]|nr:phosphonate ABC transporter, permease protein PhnE [bacterium]
MANIRELISKERIYVPKKHYSVLKLVLFSVFSVAFGAFFAYAFNKVNFSIPNLIKGLPNIPQIFSAMFKPDFNIMISKVLPELLITICTALVGTFFAALFAIPLSFAAASNLVSKKVARGISFLFNLGRSIDVLIYALIFVVAVGLGPFAGMLALAIHSIGMLGKLYAGSIEEIDKGQVEALVAAGASKLEVIRWAVIPQIIPSFINFTLYRFELNVRVGVVIGLVGGGGIGALLIQYMANFDYSKVGTILITILVIVMLIEFTSTRLRKQII